MSEFDYPWVQTDNRSASVVQIESSKLLPMLLLLAVLAVGGLMLAAMAWNLARYAEREARLSEYYINILNQTLNEQGVKYPDYQQFKKERGDGER